MDSPLEEAVRSELVSETLKFPASWENTGKFIDSGVRCANFASKGQVGSELYKQIPYASEQGINWTAAGN
jgi:hypothetical protein